MKADIANLLSGALNELSKVTSAKALEEIRVSYLGKQGRLTGILKSVGQLPPEMRAQVGQEVNTAKQTLIDAIQGKRDTFEAQQLAQSLTVNASFDVSLPARGLRTGTLHPITQTIHRIQDHFFQLGFAFADGPEIEDDYHNFEALNIPGHHPARDMHDTFYINMDRLLRTHTSSVQIRYLTENKAPCRVISTGRVYRCDSDLTHTPMFHQLEGMVIDKQIHMGHLKGLLAEFLSAFFERELKMRFRASYFPFTEPSAEVDVQCVICDGHGCRVCKQSGWLEILGCGMMHPNVLQHAGIDPDVYQGIAFGVGIERLAMLRHGIPDLRLFFENDQPFLRQFP